MLLGDTRIPLVPSWVTHFFRINSLTVVLLKGAEARAVSPLEDRAGGGDTSFVLLQRPEKASPQALGSLQMKLRLLPTDVDLDLLRRQNHFSHHPLSSQDRRLPCTPG